jgi:hypothetical protein
VAARLVIQRQGEAALPIEIGSGVTLGAGASDAVRVPGLAEGALVASPSAGGGVILEARAAGVLVAGTPLSPGRRRLLRPGERAAAGGLALWPELAARLDGTRVMAGAILAGASPTPPRGPRLVVVEGPAAGQCLALRDGAVLGRGREAELQLEDPLASRRHVVFTIHRGRPCLRDLSSKNGLAVNGRRAGRHRIILRPGDALALGESMLVYEDGGAAAPALQRVSRRQERPGAGRTAVGLAALALIALAALLAIAAG